MLNYFAGGGHGLAAYLLLAIKQSKNCSNPAGVFSGPAGKGFEGAGVVSASALCKRSINPVLVDGVCFQEAKGEAGEQLHGSSAS